MLTSTTDYSDADSPTCMKLFSGRCHKKAGDKNMRTPPLPPLVVTTRTTQFVGIREPL